MQSEPTSRSSKVSGYLNIFDDWEILPEALASIDDLVDEIVVVDGPYEWMTPFVARADVTRSRDEVYDALAPFQRKLKLHRQVWADETQKRQAGYELCSGRYVLRHDADEVFFPDAAALDGYFSSGLGVAQINMPIFVTPQYRRARADRLPEHQGALFDRNKISAADHLGYLWLVLPKELEVNPPSALEIFPNPFAFVAHLTAWRGPDTAINRALFYTVLHALNNGPAWYDRFLQDPAASREALLGHAIVAGPLHGHDSVVVSSGLDDDQKAILRPIYERYLSSLAALNRELAGGRLLRNGFPYSMDLTTAAARDALGSTFRFDQPLAACEARLTTLQPDEPFSQSCELPVTVDGATVRVDLPSAGDRLQTTLTLIPRGEGDYISLRTASA